MPNKTMLRIRWKAWELASACLVKPAPLSGSKIFLLMIVSVPTIAAGGVTVFELSATTGALALPELGRSQGPAVQSQYVLASTNPMATTRKMLNNEDRVKIVQSFNLNRKKTTLFYFHLTIASN